MSKMDRQQLSRWTPAKLFQAEVRGLLNNCDSADYFCAPENQWLRDAYLASKFSEYAHARTVRLVDESLGKPDFEVRLRNENCLLIEATEADLPGRRRGDEYRDAKAEGYPLRHDPGEKWKERRDAIPGQVAAAVERKLRKSYPTDTSLLIYVNLATYGFGKRRSRQRSERMLLPHEQNSKRFGQSGAVGSIAVDLHSKLMAIQYG